MTVNVKYIHDQVKNGNLECGRNIWYMLSYIYLIDSQANVSRIKCNIDYSKWIIVTGTNVNKRVIKPLCIKLIIVLLIMLDKLIKSLFGKKHYQNSTLKLELLPGIKIGGQ